MSEEELAVREEDNGNDEHAHASDAPPTPDGSASPSANGTDSKKRAAEDEDAWFYLDTEMTPQGPFTFAEMDGWHRGGYFTPDLKVMKVGEDDFVPISTRREFARQEPRFELPVGYELPSTNPSLPATPGFAAAPARQASAFELLYASKNGARAPSSSTGAEYGATGVFNTATGRFQSQTSEQYFASKGMPGESAGRQMAHYFDMEAYQEQKRREKESGRPKKVKNWRELKDAKKRRKQQNYVKNLLKD